YAFSTQVAEQTRKTGYVTSLAGRRRYIRTIDSRNTLERARAERMALNTQIQSSAADIVKIAMIAIQRAFARRPLRAQLLLQV
ncbi:DNA polymerase, partial [Treponema pallidum]